MSKQCQIGSCPDCCLNPSRPHPVLLKLALALALQAASLCAQTANLHVSFVLYPSLDPAPRVSVTLTPLEIPSPGAPPARLPGVLIRRARSNAAGKVSFDSLPPGPYRLTYQPGDRTAPTDSRLLELEPGRSVEITIQVFPPWTVTGTVLDDAGQPARALVYVLVARESLGRTQWLVDATGFTNRYGRFAINGLHAGKAAFAATSAGPGSGLQLPDLEKAVTLEPGGTVDDVALRIRPQSTYALRGRVIDVDGTPAADASVSALIRGTNMSFARETARSNGSFAFSDLPAATYVLAASLPGRVCRAEVALTSSFKDLDLRCPPDASIAVVPSFQGPPPPEQGVVGLLPADAGFETEPRYWRLSSGEPFRIGPIQPGLYMLQVGLPPPHYLASALLGGEDVTGRLFQITEKPEDLRLEIRSDTGAIAVKTASPAGRNGDVARAILAPPDAALWHARALRAAAPEPDGSFRFRHVPPGDYLLFVLRNLPDRLPVDDLQWLRARRSAGRLITVRPSATTAVTFP